MPKVAIAVLVAVFLCLLSSCTRTGTDSSLRELDCEALLAMSTYGKEGLDSLATLLLEKAVEAGSRKYQGYAHFYLSSYSPRLDDSVKVRKMWHLDRAEAIAEETGNDTLLCYVYNQRGVWELGELNVSTAQYWFKRSLDKARSLEKRFWGIPAEMNMLETCRIADDTLGIVYARNLFDYSKSRNEPLLMFVSGYHCALYYSDTAKDTAELRPYIDALRMQEEGFEGAIPMVYAQFYYNHGEYRKAEEMMQGVKVDEDADFLVLYAEILNKLGKYRESERQIGCMAPELLFGNLLCRKKIMRLHVDNMASIGDWRGAYRRQKELEAFRDSMEQISAHDLTKRYRIEYEVYAKDREILEQGMRIRNLYWGISAIVVVIASGVIVYFLWNRRKNRFYKDIVRQNCEFIERQNILSERIAYRDAKIAELEQGNSGVSVRHSRISDEKADEIFDRIQRLADDEQVWRDTNITRDAFADMVGCNRTYFTEVLKSKTGMNYSQYMNSCRVREAVRVLSNPEDETPLKDLSTRLGFFTIQTFYAQFKQEIGMSPSAFRKTAKE